MKSGLIWRMVAIVALILSSGAAILFLERVPARHLASLVGVTVTTTPRPSISAQPADVQTSMFSLGTVAVQTFSGSLLVQAGAGTAVSSDGLIVTTAYVAPYGSGSYVYQVATASGALLRATRVWRDGSGLVLLKVSTTDLDPVSFDGDIQIQAGMPVDIMGAFIRLSHYTPIVLSGQVPYFSDSRDIPLSFDRSFYALLSAARVIDGSGHSLGLVQLTPDHARLIPATVVNSFVERYLASTQR